MALLLQRNAAGGAQKFRQIQQVNTFSPFFVLKHADGIWTLAQADSISSADIWLCVGATSTAFNLAICYCEYYYPNHGIGADNSALYLSAVTPGLLTTTAPTTGQARVILGAIVDANHILWAPSLSVEVV